MRSIRSSWKSLALFFGLVATAPLVAHPGHAAPVIHVHGEISSDLSLGATLAMLILSLGLIRFWLRIRSMKAASVRIANRRP